MRIAVLTNPKSGRGAGARRWSAVEARLRERADVTVVRTVSVEDLADRVQGFVEAGYEVVAAAGGDGTLNLAMQGVIGSASALGVLPLGTGNDFARTLGVVDLDKALDALVVGRIVEIDVGRWRQERREGYFLNVAGCGFDAAVADTINRGVRRLRGRPAYLAAILGTLMRYRPVRLSMVVDGEPLEGEAMLCAFANAQRYGAGLKIAPMANLQDGLLDLVMVGPLGRLELLRNLPKLGSGRHLDHPKVSHRTFRELTLRSDPPSPFLVDGELLPAGPVEIEVAPKGLKIVVPADFGTRPTSG